MIRTDAMRDNPKARSAYCFIDVLILNLIEERGKERGKKYEKSSD